MSSWCPRVSSQISLPKSITNWTQCFKNSLNTWIYRKTAVKTAVKIEPDLITDYKNKLKIDDFLIPDQFKIPQGWMEEDEEMTFWPMLSYPDVLNFLMLYPSDLGSKELRDCQNSNTNSVHKLAWLQPLEHHNLWGSKYCIIRVECRKSHSIRDPFHKLLIIP